MCLDVRKRHKRSKHLSFRHTCNEDVKRTTDMFEGILIDPFDNDNPSDHILNFPSGVVTTSAVKESLLKAVDKGSQVSINFTKKQVI